MQDSCVVATWGTTVDPFRNVGIKEGRHTLITEQGVDTNTGGALKFLPPGESKVIRIGNASVNGEAESISYRFIVDLEHSILFLKFAVVFEDPAHTDVEQPRFIVRIMDTLGNLIESCAEYDVYSRDGIEGFQDYIRSGDKKKPVRWRDWTNVGLDMSRYAGQEVIVQFVSYDCSKKGHFGYAYFTASCTSNKIQLKECKDGNLTVVAPEGFSSYLWDDGTPTAERQITMAGKDMHLRCEIESVTGCKFTLYAYVSSMDGLPDSSYVVYDTICEGESYTDHHYNLPAQTEAGTFVYYNTIFNPEPCTGHVTITLILTIQRKQEFLDAEICYGEDYRANGFNVIRPEPGFYTENLSYVSDIGCDNILTLNLTVHAAPIVNVFTEDSVMCSSKEIELFARLQETDWNNSLSQIGIGDVITNDDGSKGVVFWLSADKKGGWMVALNDLPGIYPWGEKTNISSLKDWGETEAYKDTAGYANTQKIRNQYGGTEYAAQNVRYETAWYLPALGQLKTLRDSMSRIASELKANGGRLLGEKRYWSSTEEKRTRAYLIDFSDGTFLQRQKDTNKYFVREVRSFTTDLTYRWNTTETTTSILSTPTQTTDYSVEVRTARGCTVSDTLRVILSSPQDTTIYGEICEGETYTLNGFDESSTGVYTQKVKSVYGCDSTVTLELTVRPIVRDTIFDDVCSGRDYTANGFELFNLSESNTHYLNAETQYGCDSIVVLHLTVLDSSRHDRYDTVKLGDPYHEYGWHIARATQSEVYQRPAPPNAVGCDSVEYLHLTVYPVFDTLYYDTICTGSAYNRYDFDIPTIISDTLLVHKYSVRISDDSIVSVQVKVHPNYSFEEKDTICEGDLYVVGNDTLKNSCIHPILLFSQYGCDSLINLHLTVLASSHHNRYDTVKFGDVYNRYGWHIARATQSDVHHRQAPSNAVGCDSIEHLHLTVHPVFDTLHYDTICSGSAYNRYDFNIPTIISDTLLVHKYSVRISDDSIVSVQVKVHPHPYTLLQATICQGESYLFDHKILNSSGIHEMHLPSQYGCDSLVELRLTVLDSSRHDRYDTVKLGESYHKYGWYIATADQSKTYYRKELKNAAGCDSVEYLHLTVSPVFDILYHDTICSGKGYAGHDFGLAVVTSDTLLVKKYISSEGEDYTVSVQLNVQPNYFFERKDFICQGEEYIFDGRVLSESGNYQMLFETRYGCDSIYELQLTVHPHRDTLIEDVFCEGTRYKKYGFDQTEPGIYTRVYSGYFGCDSTVTLHLRREASIAGEIQVSLENCEIHEYFFSFLGEMPDSSSIISYFWDFGNGKTSDSETVYHYYPDTGSYNVSLVIQTKHGCTYAFSHELYVPYFSTNLKVGYYPAKIDSEQSTVSFEVDVPDSFHCEWDFGDGKKAVGNKVVHTYQPENTDHYIVTLLTYNADSCPAVFEFRIDVLPGVNPPNTFSPNDDGINDVFMPGHPIKVSNRNGVVIFEGTDGWDGTYKGKRVSEDTYFYELHYETISGMRIKKGYITVIR
ncbi:gliding motility-associated C-terminal domain-containing protein [Odoribacter sp. OttesenSCG-928-J03]|nr:gliding motility-associated C-terminal domain-containing protein [Odoribacter sp. OttesenSCG-928-J03]